MNIKKTILIFLILTVSFSCINAVVAINDDNLTQISDNTDVNDLSLSTSDDADDAVTVSENNQEDNQLKSNSYVVKPDSKVPNQVLRPTVQPVIDDAEPGDTIILSGNFVHCHFVVDKPLTIKAQSELTTLSTCPHHNNPEDSSNFGVFYLTSNASGTVIEGFNFFNNDYDKANVIHHPFAIYIDGASNVTIRDCTVNWNLDDNSLFDPIIINNAQNILITDNYFNNSHIGVIINNSSLVTIQNSVIENCRINGIYVCNKSDNIAIVNNQILKNRQSGVNLSSAEGIHILNNLFIDNGISNQDSGSGIYIDANISDSEIKGNVFISNMLHAVMFDYHVKNIAQNAGDDLLVVIDSNYFASHKDMVIHRRTYEKSENGLFNYDAETDTFYPAYNGEYYQTKDVFYMKHAFLVNEMVCGFTYSDINTPWSKGKDYKLYASITKIKDGSYSLSIVDAQNNVASDFNSLNVTFYLNNNTNNKKLPEGAIYKSILTENGVATVDFTDKGSEFILGNNVLSVFLPENDVINYVDSRTWIVEPDADNPNQVQAPTVQPIIDKAAPGDIIVLKGNFVHCHFIIDKPLTIIAEQGSSLGVCPHHQLPVGSGNYGILYFTSNASGSKIEGLTFTNDYYNLANTPQNPFAIYIDGASDIVMNNITVNWQGKAVDSSHNPNDYLFSPIILNSANNITLNASYINNTKIGVSISNSTNIKIIDSTIVNSQSAVFISKNSSELSIVNNKATDVGVNAKPEVITKVITKSFVSTKLTVKKLSFKAGDTGKLQITLKTSSGKVLANKEITVIINGVVKKAKTNSNGIATITLKYSSVGTYNAVILFAGDNDYKSNYATSKISVVKKTAKITAPAKTFKIKATKKISITLKYGNKAIKSKKITLKVNGKSYVVKTNAKGIATFNIKLIKKGTFKYTVKFAGDSMYKAVSKTGKIIIKK